MPTTRLYTTVRLLTGPALDCIILLYYPQPTTRQYTSGLLPTDPLTGCILVIYYLQAYYQTVYYYSTTHRPTTRLTSTVLLPTCPLPVCILLFGYLQNHIQTLYYCSTILLGCKLSTCYQQAHYQSAHHYQDVYYCPKPSNRMNTRLNTTVPLPTGPLPDWILLFCRPYYCSPWDLVPTPLYLHHTSCYVISGPNTYTYTLQTLVTLGPSTYISETVMSPFYLVSAPFRLLCRHGT